MSDQLIKGIQKLIDEADIVVGFNFKFDVHWLRSVGIDLSRSRIWDCQIAEFLVERQTNPYPSLEDSAVKYGLGHKIDIIKTEYWDKGINTDAIPWDVLRPYAIQDAVLTYQLYLKQTEVVPKHQRKLLALLNQDLLVLAEMEWNGLVFNKELCEKRSKECGDKITDINQKLSQVYPDVPLNFGSVDQLSSFLYGGVVKETIKEHIGFFKTGKQIGEPRYRNKEVEHILPRLCTPLKGSELKKEGFYATSEDVLKQLKGPNAKKYVAPLLELSKLEKLNGTYYQGLPNLSEKMNWRKGYLHGNFNQCTTATGRLSSSKPNLQNFASELQDVFITRYS